MLSHPRKLAALQIWEEGCTLSLYDAENVSNLVAELAEIGIDCRISFLSVLRRGRLVGQEHILVLWKHRKETRLASLRYLQSVSLSGWYQSISLLEHSWCHSVFSFKKQCRKGLKVDRVLKTVFLGDAGRRKISCVYPWHSCSQSVRAQRRLSSTRSWCSFTFSLSSVCLRDTVWLKQYGHIMSLEIHILVLQFKKKWKF